MTLLYKTDSADYWHRKGDEYRYQSDDIEAMRCYCKAAEKGGDPLNWIGSHSVGICGAEPDFTEARRWAVTTIARLYEYGEIETQNYIEAMRWYRMAADQGDGFAIYTVGRLYHNGKGVTKNLEIAGAN